MSVVESKTTGRNANRTRLLVYGCVLLAIQPGLPVAPAWAAAPSSTQLPTGGAVTSGSASIAASGATLNINQSSQKATINWNSFDVGAQATVNFNQPNAGAQTLNRVIAGDASQIFGHINANGQVFLINPNGIIFGAGSQVNAAGLVASTLDITDQDFQNGNYKFQGNGSNGSVTNQGTLTAAPGGYVALIGSAVSNQGIINTPAGKAILAAGGTVQVPLTDSGLISLDVDAADVDGVVTNDTTGDIEAPGGQVYMAAEAGSNNSANITNRGIVNADQASLTTQSGSVFVDSGSAINARNITVNASAITGSGNFVATGAQAAVALNAGYVSLAGSVTANNGADIGGAVAIAGANAVLLSSTSFVAANGLTGGNVSITAPQGYVLASGIIEAIGSAGLGGTVQVSGANSTVLLAATVNASGSAGGGIVNIGGGWHGAGSLLVSGQTTVDTTSSISADATSNGDGGQVVLWSSSVTTFFGNIFARGGPGGGDGGQVELSSADTINVQISNANGVNVLARNASGTAGLVTVDPANIVIGNSDSIQALNIFETLVGTGGTTNTYPTEILGSLATISNIGASVALNNSYALIGASGVGASGTRGDVYLYNLASGAWTDLATTSGQPITAFQNGGYGLQNSIALNSSYALIGASALTANRGSAYLYNLATGAWTNLATTTGQPITALASSAKFGSAVALSSGYALIGASGVSTSRGDAFLYNLTTGAWTDLATTTSQPVTALATSSSFGVSVALNSSYALIGASGVSTSRGDAFLYNLSTGAWTDLATTTGQPVTALATNAFFGFSAALNSSYALIGAYGVSTSAGDVYLYNLSTGAWTDLATTAGEPIIASAKAGYSVALNNNYALIGAEGVSTSRGDAYLYNLSTGAWTDLATTVGQPVTGIGGNATFGYSVALNSDYALIGAFGTVTASRGEAYLYNLSSGAWTNLVTSSLHPILTGSPQFGSTVAASDSYALIGAQGHNDAYLYNLTTGVWTDLATTAGQPVTAVASGSYFGVSLALNNNYALVGSYAISSSRGDLYLYNLTTGAWTDLAATAGQPITALAANAYFGRSVALNSNYALIGVSGVSSERGDAYLYNLSTGAWTDLATTTGQPITALASNSEFGGAVALTDAYALIGAYGATGTRGNAYLYNLSTGGWTNLATTTGQPITALAINSYFGIDVALNSNYALIGAYGVSSMRGDAYLYKLSTGSWTDLATTTGQPVTALAANAYFGEEVALNSSYALIGAPNVSSARGDAYVYNLSTGGWTDLATTTGQPVTGSTDFGISVALNTASALIGEANDAYFYNLTSGAWTNVAELGISQPFTIAAAGQAIGSTVALSATYALMGGTGGGSKPGDAYLYNLTTGVWTDLETTAGAPTSATANLFGGSVALSSNYALIGATGVSSSRGDAYLYNLSTGVWTDLATTASQPITALAANSSFGVSTALNTSYALIGASGVSTSRGDAYLYNLSTGAWTDLATTTSQPVTALATSSSFGISTALNTSYALIGASGISTSRGDAYLYNLSTGGWTDLATTTSQPITALATSSSFGITVALNSSYALIGATTASTHGDVYLYNLSGGWTNLATTSGELIGSLAGSATVGSGIALSSTYALIGAGGDVSSRGDAFLYNLSTGAWTDLATTTGQPITGLTSAKFGISVALNNTYALIGASGALGTRGEAFLYNLSGSWIDLTSNVFAVTVPSSASFGSSVALNTGLALIGANSGGPGGQGDAYLYNLVTGSWTDLAATSGQPITALASGSAFGVSVALNSGYALIGATGVSSNRGDAYLYNLSTDIWTDLAATSGQPITALASSASFGVSGALNSNYALIGAVGVSNSRGDAYLYNLSTGAWTDLATTTGQPVTALASTSFFGYGVALNSTYALISAPDVSNSRGDAYLYNLSTGGWTDLATVSGQPVTALAYNANFGNSVALNNTYALIGATGASSSGEGDAYLYNISAGSWTDLAATAGQPITALAAGATFGNSVALNSNYALIAATGLSSNRGDAYVYNLTTGAWTDLATVTGQPITALSSNSYFGQAVALNDTYALVGAYGVSSNQGNAYLISLPLAMSQPSGASYISVDTINAGLATGNYSIVADNSLIIQNMGLLPLNTGNSLTLEAGGSIDIEGAVSFGGRSVTLLANGPSGDLGTPANRAAGGAGIAIETFGSLNDGSGALTIQIDTAASTGRSGSAATAGNFTLLGAITTGSVIINGAESAVNLASTIGASGTGDAILLNGLSESFSGSGINLVTVNGNWLVYNELSGSLGTVSLNGLAQSFDRYGCTYAGGCTTGAVIPATGNGVVYAYAPTLTLSGVTASNKVYNGTTVATLSGGTITGAVNGDSVALGSGIFASKDVGTGISVAYALSTAYGYILSGPALTANITPATLTGVITANNKVYDGTTTATLATMTLSGTFYGSDASNLSLTDSAANFNTKDVATATTVTATGLALSGSAAGDYQLSSTSATASASITKATLTGVITANNKVYNGTTTATLASQTLSGTIYGSDASNLSLTDTSATFNTKDVATATTVTATGLALSGSAAGDYQLSSTSATASASITKATLTGVITANNKVYDGTTTATLASQTLSGTIYGSDASNLSLTDSSANFNTKDVATATTVTATGLTLSGSAAGDYQLSSTSATASASITKASLSATIVANNKVYDGTTTATLASDALSGTIYGSDASNLTLSYGGSATFNTKDVATATTVTATGFSLSGSAAGDYQLSATTASASASITPATLTGVITANNKVYDGTTNATLATQTLSGTIYGSDASNLTLTDTAAAFNSKDVPTATTVTASGLALSGSAASNYQLSATTASASATISAAPLTAVVAANNKVYDGTTTATLASTPTFTGTVYGSDGSNLGLTAASATFNSKDVATANSVSISGLALSGSAAVDYYLTNATTATASASITPATLTAVITANKKVYDGTTTATLASQTLSGTIYGSDSSGLSLTDTAATFNSKDVPTATTVTATGLALSGSAASNYQLSSNTASASASITPAGLSVTGVAATDKVYNASVADTLNVTNAVLSGVLNSDVVGVASGTGAFADANTGTSKPVSVSSLVLSGAQAADYQITTMPTGLTAAITKATITGVVTANNKVYDGTTTATLASETLSGTIYGSDASNLTLTDTAAAFNSKDVASATTVTATGLALSGSAAGNYQLSATVATTSGSITPATLTGVITANNKVYDGTNAATLATQTLSGTIYGGDASNLTLTDTSATFNSKDVPTATTVTATGLALSGSAASNYQLSSTMASTPASITPAGLTITGVAATDKAYDGSVADALNVTNAALTGVLNSDAVGVASGTGAFADASVGAAKPVSILGFILSGAQAADYRVTTFPTGLTATITAPPAPPAPPPTNTSSTTSVVSSVASSAASSAASAAASTSSAASSAASAGSAASSGSDSAAAAGAGSSNTASGNASGGSGSGATQGAEGGGSNDAAAENAGSGNLSSANNSGSGAGSSTGAASNNNAAGGGTAQSADVGGGNESSSGNISSNSAAATSIEASAGNGAGASATGSSNNPTSSSAGSASNNNGSGSEQVASGAGSNDVAASGGASSNNGGSNNSVVQVSENGGGDTGASTGANVGSNNTASSSAGGAGGNGSEQVVGSTGANVGSNNTVSNSTASNGDNSGNTVTQIADASGSNQAAAGAGAANGNNANSSTIAADNNAGGETGASTGASLGASNAVSSSAGSASNNNGSESEQAASGAGSNNVAASGGASSNNGGSNNAAAQVSENAAGDAVSGNNSGSGNNGISGAASSNADLSSGGGNQNGGAAGAANGAFGNNTASNNGAVSNSDVAPATDNGSNNVLSGSVPAQAAEPGGNNLAGGAVSSNDAGSGNSANAAGNPGAKTQGGGASGDGAAVVTDTGNGDNNAFPATASSAGNAASADGKQIAAKSAAGNNTVPGSAAAPVNLVYTSQQLAAGINIAKMLGNIIPPGATVTGVTMADGKPLPDGVTFDPATGTLQSDNFSGDLTVEVTVVNDKKQISHIQAHLSAAPKA